MSHLVPEALTFLDQHKQYSKTKVRGLVKHVSLSLALELTELILKCRNIFKCVIYIQLSDILIRHYLLLVSLPLVTAVSPEIKNLFRDLT